MSGIEELYQSIECTLSEDLIRTQIDTYVSSFPEHDLESREPLFAEDCVFTDPANAPKIEGLANLKQFWQGLKMAPFKMLPEVHQLVVCGDSALLDFTIHMKSESGTNSLRVRDILNFNSEGKIKSITAYWDPSCVTAS